MLKNQNKSDHSLAKSPKGKTNLFCCPNSSIRTPRSSEGKQGNKKILSSNSSKALTLKLKRGKPKKGKKRALKNAHTNLHNRSHHSRVIYKENPGRLSELVSLHKNYGLESLSIMSAVEAKLYSNN